MATRLACTSWTSRKYICSCNCRCFISGSVIGKGLSNYSAREMRAVQGKRSDSIARELGHAGFDEAIHRDNMVLLEGNAS